MLSISEMVKLLPSRFLSKIYAPLFEDDCWIWSASLNKGYGQVYFDGCARKAYVVIYNLCVGEIPIGLELDHICKNTMCVNPKHLEPVTHRVNVLRGNSPSAQMSRKTHCVKGHLLEGDNLRPARFIERSHRACRTCHREAMRQSNTKRIWITDNVRSVTILRTETIPEGWQRGRTFTPEYWEKFNARAARKPTTLVLPDGDMIEETP